jgi:hypothetical protein
MDNYFFAVNSDKYGKICYVGAIKHYFRCFFMGDHVPMVLLEEVETGYIVQYLLSNNLKLAFD